MAKISRTHHITRRGVVKRNPVSSWKNPLEMNHKCLICKKPIYYGMYCNACNYSGRVAQAESVLEEITKKQQKRNIFTNISDKKLREQLKKRGVI